MSKFSTWITWSVPVVGMILTVGGLYGQCNDAKKGPCVAAHLDMPDKCKGNPPPCEDGYKNPVKGYCAGTGTEKNCHENSKKATFRKVYVYCQLMSNNTCGSRNSREEHETETVDDCTTR